MDMDGILFWLGATILVIMAGGEIGGAMVMVGKNNRADDPPLAGERLRAGCLMTLLLVIAPPLACWLLSEALLLFAK